MANYSIRNFDQFQDVTKALADGNRVRILLFLRRGELCVCKIIDILGLAPSTVSKHLDILHRAGLVKSRKEGRWVYYGLPGKNAAPCACEAIQWVHRNLRDDPQTLADSKRLQAVNKMNIETLCCRYKGPQ